MHDAERRRASDATLGSINAEKACTVEIAGIEAVLLLLLLHRSVALLPAAALSRLAEVAFFLVQLLTLFFASFVVFALAGAVVPLSVQLLEVSPIELLD